MSTLQAVLFLFLCGIVLEGIEAQETRTSQQNKALAATKCQEYAAVLNQTGTPICNHHNDDQPIRDGDYPHMALIGFENTDGEYLWVCGGTLISNRYVLTAAHCGYSKTIGHAKKVRLGLTNLKGNNPNLQEFNVEKFIAHENYSPRTKYNDIALIKLDREVRFSKEVRPACLFTDDTSDATKLTNVIVTGWFFTSLDNTNRADQMIKVGLKVYSNEVCQNIYKNALKNGVTSDMLCTGPESDAKDTCQGSAGSPLVVTKEGDQCNYYVIGVISLGKSCGLGFQSINTKVSAYSDWIVDKIW